MWKKIALVGGLFGMLSIATDVLSANSDVFELHISATGDGHDSTDTLRRVIALQRRTGRPMHIVLKGKFVLQRAIQLSAGNDRVSISSAKGHVAELVAAEGAMRGIEIIGSAGVRITGLHLTGFAQDGIYVEDSKDIVIERTTVIETRSSAWSQGAIHLTGTVVGAVVNDNLIEGADYGGIHVDTKAMSDVSNIRITRNRVRQTCRRVEDCGAIYVNDRGRRSRNILIAQNIVADFGPVTTGGRGIYLDDWASHVTVRENCISGPGRFAFQIHGGHDNRIEHNHIDMAQIAEALLYEEAAKGTRPMMTGNIAAGNIFTRMKTATKLFTSADVTGVAALRSIRNLRNSDTACASRN